MEIKRFEDFNKALEALVAEKETESLRILYYPSEYKNCCSCCFVTDKHSIGMWISTTGLSIHELKFKSKKRVYNSREIREIVTTPQGFKVIFNEGYIYQEKPLRNIEVNLVDWNSSILE